MTDRTEPSWIAVFCDPDPLPATASRKDRLLYWALTTFLRPGFRHVFLLRPAHGFAGWVVVNPNSACLDVLEVVGDDYMDLIVAQVRAGRATTVTVQAVRPTTWRPRLLFSCVSTVKHVLGIAGPATTPWQLYLSLRKNNS